MKKALILFLTIFYIIISMSLPALAGNVQNDSSTTSSSQVIYLDDGSYIVTIIETEPSIFSIASPTADSYIKTGNKIVTNYNSDNEIVWQYTLHGEFTVVEGVSAVCSSATYTQVIYDNDWSFSNGAATSSENTAYGVGTFKKKFLLVTIKTVDIDISISCDVYGNLS